MVEQVGSQQESAPEELSTQFPEPDHFVYAIGDSPLHLKPFTSPNAPPFTSPNALPILDKREKQEKDRKEQKHTRDFFRFVRAHKNTLQHDTVMDNGETIGVASLLHLKNQYQRKGRPSTKSNKNKKTTTTEE